MAQAIVDAGQEVKHALHGAATGGAEITKTWFENIFGDREYYNWSYFVGGTGRPWWSRGVLTFITSGGAMTWWAVACVTISLFVTRFGPLAACLTGTKSDNMYVSYNGTCVPADYANEDVAGLTALVIGMFIMFIGFFIWLGTLMPFRDGGVIKIEPFAQSVFALMFFVIGIWCVMFSTYTFTTNKSLDTYNMNPVPNVNNTYQPPNYRDLVTPNGMPLGIMIPSIIFLIIGSIYLLAFLSAWVWTDDSLEALNDVNLRSMALNALVCVYVAVGFAVGVTWQYANPSGSYPTSLVAKQCFLTSVIFYCFGAVEVISLWAANWSDTQDVDWTLYVLPAWFWQLCGCDYGRVG